jgi:hypothetical protein
MYKRTHVGDPDEQGRFGINDCMGKVRAFRYDAVIGVGGIGYEPRRHGIDRKITWVGIGPRWNYRISGYRAVIVKFEHFILLDRDGPLLHSMAPNLACRLYSGGRYLLDAYSETEKIEAHAIIEWAKGIASRHSGKPRSTHAECDFQHRCRNPPNPSLLQVCAKRLAGK